MADQLWTREETKERFPDPLSPLGWSVLQSALDVNLVSIKNEFHLRQLNKDQVTRWVDGFLYSSKDFFKRIPFLHFSVVSILRLGFRLLGHGLVSLLDLNHPQSFKKRFLLRVYDKEFSSKVAAIISQWTTELPMHLKKFQENQAASISWEVTDKNYFSLLSKIESDGCGYNRLDFAIYFYKNLIKALLDATKTETDLTVNQLSAFSSFQIGKYISEVINIARTLKSSQQQMDYLVRHLGHLSLSWDIAQPTFSEQAELLEKMLRDSSSEKTAPTPISSQFSELESQFIQLVSCDEVHRFYASYQFPYVRSLLGRIAKNWVQNSFLIQESDLYFLTLPEIVEFHSESIQGKTPDRLLIQNKIRDRKSYIKSQAIETLDSQQMILKENLFYICKATNQRSTPIEPKQWQGTVVSGGIAQGTAYWVTNYESLSNSPQNKIILCETPSPNFHSAFIKAVAIVAETGGVLSHGAIIARELKIPCILQVHGLKSIKNGDLIEVNANSGIIKRLS